MKYRHPLAVVALSIITVGIYSIYWLYATRLEVIAKNNDPASIPRVIYLFLPLILLIGLFPLSLMFFSFSEGGDAGSNITFSILAILIGLSLIVLPVWWTYKYCMAVAGTVKGGTEGILSFIIWILTTVISLPFIWQALIQNDLNKLANPEVRGQIADTPYPTSKPPVPPAPAV